MSRRALAIAFATLLVLTQAIGVAARSAPPPPDQTGAASARVEKGLTDKLAKGELATFVVEFAASADLAPAGKVKGWAAKGKAVVASLQATAVKSQKAAKAAAKAAGAEATTYWLTNVLVVAGDAKLAERMAALDGVTAVRAPKVYPLVKPVDKQVAILAASGDPEWGVAKIGAPTAWDGGVLGQGVVVANIDTGVEYTHPALVGNYRGNNGDGTFSHDYNWWDPTGICGDEPCDNAGHGTHTMGTIAGGDGPGPFTPDIGVAPEARWIAAKGCEDFGCSETALLSSGQFILAPTDLAGANADPSRRPDVVNNSWGGGPNDQFYRETVQAWRASGIIPVFSSGNPGPECGQGGSPGDFPEVISAGATDDRDEIAEFSGRGPSAVDGKAWNPDIAAPGVDVVSSVPGGGYESFSGTSMAAPHTTGEIALLLSARPALVGDFDGIANAVRATALDRIDTTCGAAPGGDPNNVYGDGRIDAAAAVDLVKTGGTLDGAVTGSDGGVPIAGAVVTADNGTRTFNVTTAADGTFSLFLAAGDYGVTVRAFGYYGATLGPVTIVKDQTTTVAAILDPLPRFHVTGNVTGSEDGSPIADAMVAAIGTPVAPVTTAADGSYDLVLPIGDYTLRFSAGGCTETAMEEISSDGPDLVVDKGLYRKLDDFGHGCRPIAFDWVDATGQSALWGDEIAGRLRLPFPVPFYGTDYEQIWISDNGYLNFLGPDLWNSFPSGIPSTAVPNAAIYPLWQDLYLDEESQVDYAVIGDAPDRAFVLEFQGIRAWGASGRLSFEVKLWENGEIDLLYGAGPANPGDGRNALIGIENATGTDALQLGFYEPILAPDSAYRIELVPSGLLHGTVTDANDGLPIAGATVTAMPGGRTARTDADGAYTLRLRPGSYQVTADSPPYVAETGPVTMVDGGDVTLDFVLTGGLAAVEPMAVTATVDYGQTATVVLDLSNGGTAPTAWEAKERDLGATMPDLPPAATVVHRTPGWFRQAMPAGLPRVQDTTGGVPVIPIINDPEGDADGAVDVVTVSAGSDGSSVVSMKLEYAAGTPMGSLGGYVFLDTDQDPSTGEPAEWWAGKPSQDVGMEFVVDLFGLASSQPTVYLVDLSKYEVVAEAPAVIGGQAVSFDLPLEAMGDDGFINTAMVLGDQSQPTDWAPDTGHGTITPFVDLPWLDESPSSGSVPAGGSQAITLTLGGPTLAPGEYHGLLVLLTDAPTQRQLTVPVDLTVTLPEDFGAVTGMVADAHSGEPLAGAGVSVAATWNGDTLTLEATTDGDGAFRIVGPAGTWPALVTLDGYVDGSADLTIVAGKTSGPVDIGLHRLQAHAALDRDSLVFVLTPGRMGTSTITISNPKGHEPLTFTVNEVALDGGVAGVTASRAPTIANPSARTSAGTWTGTGVTMPKAIQAEGDVLASWPTGIGIPWGVGVPGNVVISDPEATTDVTFTTDGEQIGSFDLPWVGDWGADMAWDAGRGLLWQVNVGGDNGIYGLDPADGSVEAVITGDPWGGISQRGLAYDPAADVFYTGGWNEGIIYRVAGPSHGTPGEMLGQCSPADPSISGLAWNPAFGLLWMSTNSETDSIYLVDPMTCETLRSLPHPDGGGYGGAGIEMDVVGNLWLTGQNSGNAYLVDSGLPVFSDVPWLTESPTEGTVDPDGSATVDVTADATGLEPGVYSALVVIGTNDPANSFIPVPVTLVVPSYQQGVNAGGPAHVDGTGTAFAPDRAFSAGDFGYVGPSSTRSTRSAIEGTDDDPLYQDLRSGMTSYRFTVAEGTYRVDLAFAEIVAKKAGARVFSITIEGETVVANLDVFAQAGGRYTALDRSFLVAVTDGTLDIGFIAQRGDAPIVNAILVTEVPEGSPDW
jgi:subtilisin family serine protease